MLDRLSHLVDSGAIPFILGAVGGAGGHNAKPNITRIVEAIIIALLSAGATILVLQKDVQYLKESSHNTNTRLDKFIEKQDIINLDIYKRILSKDTPTMDIR